MTKRRYIKGTEVLPVALIDIVQQTIEAKMPEFSGGYVYIPSRYHGDVRSKTKSERAFLRAQSIIAVHDGFTCQEAATMAGVSVVTINNWINRFGHEVRHALSIVWGNSDD